MKVKMVMRMVMFTVMMVLFGGAVMAKEPKGCKIYPLRGTSHGESWTPSVPIKSLVTVALKNPNPGPWKQIDFEFESSSGANVGTLELVRKDPILNLTLNSWATTVHSGRGRTQAFQNKGSFKKLMNLHDWVYLNVSTAEKVKLTVNTSSVVFHRVNPKGFNSLYVRVPAGQDLDVGFNCGQAKTKMGRPAGTDDLSEEEEGTNSSKMIVIVGILVALLICGVVVYWCLGRKKRNALIEKLKQDEEALLESGFENAPSSRRESAKREKVVEVGEETVMLQDVDKCDDCGDEIIDETVDRCDDCGDEIHEEEKSCDVDRDKEKPRDVDRDEEKPRDVDRDEEKPRYVDMDEEKPHDVDIDEKSSDVDRDEEKPRYVDMDEEKPGDVDRDEKPHDMDRDEEKSRDMDMDEEKPRDVDRDEEKPRDVDRVEEKPCDMDRDEEKPRDMDRDEEKSRDVDRDEEKPRDVDRDEEKQEGKDKDVHENEGDCSCSDEEHE